MFDTKINNDQKLYAWKLVNKTNFGRRGYGDGDINAQYTGILGEVVMADIIGVERPTGKNGSDNGIDFVVFGKNVDLKTMGRHCPVKPFFTNNLRPYQVSAPNCLTDAYLFSSINKDTSIMTFVGYFRKDHITERYLIPAGAIRQRGKSEPLVNEYDNYEIDCADLFPVNGSMDLTWAVGSLFEIPVEEYPFPIGREPNRFVRCPACNGGMLEWASEGQKIIQCVKCGKKL